MEKFIKNFFESVVLQNKDKLRKYFLSDAKIRWHCTNEEFNVEDYLIANCEYPGLWDFEIENFMEADNKIIVIARIFSKLDKFSCHVVSIFKIENNKIKELDEYFGDDGLAPKWRIDKNIGKKIK